ncbi:hypothetical protein LUZ61_000244 [Rhynchospora tenuis]|uniref:DUF547 domain-containing protein n=1 Tax=Rhynchospora tenuis TaxID=198213 RepID=A0AAD5ZF32_9POAL|nr:hypothetical protein LUZ61_000244 [Rhynchospora tenuis]
MVPSGIAISVSLFSLFFLCLSPSPSFMEEDYAKQAARTECKTFYTPEMICWRVPNVHADIMDVSPRLSYYNPTINLERRLNGQNSPKIEEVLSRCESCRSIDGSFPETDQKAPGHPIQGVLDLINEISVLETEVVLLERRLLSLYRTAFSRYLSSSYSDSPVKEENPVRRNNRMEIDHVPKLSSEVDPNRQPSVNISSPTNQEILEMSESISENQSHVRHPDTSAIEDTMTNPCKLSQDILKCLSSIYCKLATEIPDQDMNPLASSPTNESASSSSTPSSKDQQTDSWSPKLESVTDVNSPYIGSVAISEMSISSDKFSHASKMLEVLRSLIRDLVGIDPRKMEDDEKLAFWINVHNALVMHSLLAYGLQDNKVKRTYLVLKAAYDVGGKSLNAHTIRTSILGCESNCQSKFIYALLSPTKRFAKRHKRHPYGLSKPEPLCHFALCTGASSDPMVRLYTSQGVYEELEIAKFNYIQENVAIRGNDKIKLPKVLHCYAKDASLELREIIEMVCKCMHEPKRKALESCLTKKPEKCVEWLPFHTNFRYVVHGDLAAR